MFQEKKRAKTAIEELKGKAYGEIFPLIRRMERGEYEPTEEEVLEAHERALKIGGMALGLQRDCAEKRMESLAGEAAGLYADSQKMIEAVEKIAEKRKIPLEDEE
ncbi:MAG: hypothetical protein QXU82_02510 [Candidatus Aenigmatarchaeota archaeon]